MRDDYEGFEREEAKLPRSEPMLYALMHQELCCEAYRRGELDRSYGFIAESQKEGGE